MFYSPLYCTFIAVSCTQKEKTEEETTMKTIAYRTNGHPAYPNAAAKGYKLNRLLDYLLTGAAGFGIVTALLFFVSLN